MKAERRGFEMNSHEYANKLKELAEFLLSRPEFETSTDRGPSIYQYFWSKEPFLAAVKALGAGTKEYDSTDLNYSPAAFPYMKVSISRTKVCRKVQEEKWECEPLLSQEEEMQIGAAQVL